jgi:hypothetical protein
MNNKLGNIIHSLEKRYGFLLVTYLLTFLLTFMLTSTLISYPSALIFVSEMILISYILAFTITMELNVAKNEEYLIPSLYDVLRSAIRILFFLILVFIVIGIMALIGINLFEPPHLIEGGDSFFLFAFK